MRPADLEGGWGDIHCMLKDNLMHVGHSYWIMVKRNAPSGAVHVNKECTKNINLFLTFFASSVYSQIKFF